jgi:probable rRNA maturation factor
MIILQKPMSGVNEASLARFLTRAKRAAGLRGSVNVLVAGNRELRSLNRRFRYKDKPTDVLSFPANVGMRGVAGDVAISLEIARTNAYRLGHPVADEVKILMLHGLLHLAGYDHETDNGKMARREDSLRKRLGLPVALIGRNGDPIAAAASKHATMRNGRPKR